MCFVWISVQITIVYVYSINKLVFFNTETEIFYCALQTGSLYIVTSDV